MQKSLFFYDFHFMERNQMVHDIASTDEKKYQKTKKIPYGIFFQTVDKVVLESALQRHFSLYLDGFLKYSKKMRYTGF